MYNMGNNIQNTRFLRFLIILGAVVLTIFLYASYYSSRSLELPHIRSGVSAALSNRNNKSSYDSNNAVETNNHSMISSASRKIADTSNNITDNINAKHIPLEKFSNISMKHHREPTIDVELPDDAHVDNYPDTAGEDHEFKDQQYPQILDANLVNTNITGHLQPAEQLPSNINKIPDSDVLIPTSNLQKFIENADKILKSMNSSLIIEKLADKGILSNKDQLTGDEPLKDPHISVVMPLSSGVHSIPSTQAFDLKSNDLTSTSSSKVTNTSTSAKSTTSLDPTRGIQTKQIYESGHLDDEINIQQICPDEGIDIKLLILITSAQIHQEARLSIRQTWGHYGIRRDVSTVFILGRSTNETLNVLLKQENLLYGDLIRGNFLDSYNNLTLKTISSLEWVDRHCSKAKYILKTDDDMFINVPKLLLFLDKHSKEKRVIYGRLAKKWKPIRNKKSKYYVSTGQFAATIFPPFTTGPAYVMSSDIIHDLYQRSLQQTYLKLEDVFTTGIIAQQLGIKRIHVNEFLNRRIAFNPCNIRKTISVHMIKSNEQFDLWKKLLDQTTKCK